MLLTVEVEDTGIGIVADDLDRIFDYCKTIGSANETDKILTGLELPIVKLAVSQMGGELFVSSTPNIGSRLYFSIPVRLCSDQRDTPAALPSVAPIGQSAVSKDVLIVDDNEINLTLMYKMVQRMGHRCVLATNGQEAVEKATATHFDVILMDFSMPVMDGQIAAMHIRNDGGLSADSLMIGVTALVIPISQQYQSPVFDKVLIKPVGIALLQAAMDQVRMQPTTTPEPATEEADELDAAFAVVATMVGEHKARELLAVGMQDVDTAIEAMMDLVRDPPTSADIIHKAVGSIAFLGLTDLSDILSECESLVRSGKDPAEMMLVTAAMHLMEEIRQHYAASGIL